MDLTVTEVNPAISSAFIRKIEKPPDLLCFSLPCYRLLLGISFGFSCGPVKVP
ncbi:hypothetical protein SLEP1_g17516 [Rubroshorea leprosula]|uniref:Uncharacterized protein n=1 Tax=Rubroshorea leprosula TaxID=152421 RepID=A0AAV5IY92_9ROSI|nr:hypothetical protein SLEP1_g17516 [Rubroshorea leprosula]